VKSWENIKKGAIFHVTRFGNSIEVRINEILSAISRWGIYLSAERRDC
jgi:hypothetical protein